MRQTAPPKILCVNGYYLSQGTATCLCHKLWESSYLLDLNGNVFHCDVVTRNYTAHFYDDITTTSDGLTLYGPYTEDELQVVLASLSKKQARQVEDYVMGSAYQPIMYALDARLPPQSILPL